MRHPLYLSFILLFFHFMPLSAFASEPLVACSLPLPPQTFQNKDGQPDGHATRILQHVAGKLKWSLEIRYMPWLRVVEEARNGKCDAIYTVLKRTDYEEFLVFPQQYVQSQANVLVVRKGSGIVYDGNLEAFMRKHTLGMYRDKAVDDHFEVLRHAPWARIDQATTPRINLQKLLAGRFDAAIENNLTAIYQLRELGALDQAELLRPVLNQTYSYIAFPKAGRLVGEVKKFDAALLKFKATAKYKALVDYARELQ